MQTRLARHPRHSSPHVKDGEPPYTQRLLTDTDPGAISVVITTFERPQACERALRSVLDQTEPPLEVLICDNGSRPEVAARGREWEQDRRVRYLRLDANTGTPAAPRNLGIARARGDWVAFLDDDDEWLRHKLARQRELIGGADVIASNALRSSGGIYFRDSSPLATPGREQLLRANPIITSSSLVRRALIRFPEPRWLGGVEDYVAWLDLADRGARFAILGEPLVRYEDGGSERLSGARLRNEVALARLAWRRSLRWPPDGGYARAALRRTAGATYLAADEMLHARSRHR
jgi:teichuronic acid biosynthesis glycosyltransferase TuaG